MESLLSFGKLDYYALILAGVVFLTGIILALGNQYLKITAARKTTGAVFKMLVNPPFAFAAVMGLFYSVTREFNWIFIGTATFLSVIVLVAALSDLTIEKKAEK